jgi:hypothetical protein
MRKNKEGLYKVNGITRQGEKVSAFVFAKYDFGAVFELEQTLGIKLASASVSGKPIEKNVWQ